MANKPDPRIRAGALALNTLRLMVIPLEQREADLRIAYDRVRTLRLKIERVVVECEKIVEGTDG